MKTRTLQLLNSRLPRGGRVAAALALATSLSLPLLMGTSAHAQTAAITPATSQGAGPSGTTVGTPTPGQTNAATPAPIDTAAPPVTRPSSAASAPKTPRRFLSQDEKRDSATAPGALRPSDPVVPQVRIALGRNADGPTGVASGAATAGTIDDDAARCRAQANASDRARCGAGQQKMLPKPSLKP